jgi:hypothetical protein
MRNNAVQSVGQATVDGRHNTADALFMPDIKGKKTFTLSYDFVIIPVPPQQCLHERASMLPFLSPDLFVSICKTKKNNFRCSTLCVFFLHTKVETLYWYVSVSSSGGRSSISSQSVSYLLVGVVTLGQVSLYVLRFYPVSLIQHILLTFLKSATYIIWCLKQCSQVKRNIKQGKDVSWQKVFGCHITSTV